MNPNKITPFIKAEQSLPEITVKAIILAVFITAVLAAANAYLALKLGQTISASIPAAVISMAALRLFKKHNVLENNIVQTAASGGEGGVGAIQAGEKGRGGQRGWGQQSAGGCAEDRI